MYTDDRIKVEVFLKHLVKGRKALHINNKREKKRNSQLKKSFQVSTKCMQDFQQTVKFSDKDKNINIGVRVVRGGCNK